MRGKLRWGESGAGALPGRRRRQGGLCKPVDDAVASGWAHIRTCATLEVDDVRVHRWRARLRDHGTLVDRAPGGNPVHRLLAWEEDAILEDQGLLDPATAELLNPDGRRQATDR